MPDWTLELVQNHGLWALFLLCFLSATLLPVSSELALLALSAAGQHGFWELFLVATTGNFLGGLTNYAIGFFGQQVLEKSLVNQRMHRFVKRYGSFAAFFSWLPFVGDPLVVVLGYVRSHLGWTAFWMLLGKALRYFVLLFPLF